MAPKDHIAARATGLFLIMMGLMGLMIGGIMSGLCLIANGIICEGTFVGTIGRWGLLLGLAGFLLGLLLFIPANKAHRAAQAVRRAQLQERSTLALQRAAEGERRLMRAELGEEATGPIASKCPECGAPVEPGAKECDYCGQPFV